MANVNLLPWRDAQRQEKKKEFFTILAGFCVLGLLCGFVWVTSVQSSIDNQNSRNTRLTNEIKALEEQVKEIQGLRQQKAELIARMDVIQVLEGTRPVIVRYVDDLVRAVPDGVFFTLVQRTGDNFILHGFAESQPRVADLLRNIDKSDWFKNPGLNYSRANNQHGEGMFEFDIRASADAPSQNSSETGGS